MTTGDMKRLMAMWRRRHRESVKAWGHRLKPRYPLGNLICSIGGLWVFWSDRCRVQYFDRLQCIKYARCESDGHAMHIPGLVFIW